MHQRLSASRRHYARQLLHKHMKISHRRHTGRVLPHEYTSYLPLAVLLIFVGLLLTVSTVSAAGSDPPPQAGSIGLTGTMPEKPPTTAAQIDSPTNNQHFNASPVAVTGTCPKDTLVEIFKNDIFAGSAPCNDNGTFSLDIDLLIGNNNLIARVFDVLNQQGPDSNPVTTFYDALPPQTSSLAPLNFASDQLILNTDAIYRGIFPGQPMTIPVSIIGGVPPYAVNIQWGDSTNSIVPRNNNVTFNVNHTYTRPGTFQITLQGTDSQGRVAFLEVAAIVNGQPSLASSGSTTPTSVNALLVIWPLYAIAATMVASFWLGERREKHILSNPNLTLHPQA